MHESNGIARAEFTRKQRYAARRTYTKTEVYDTYTRKQRYRQSQIYTKTEVQRYATYHAYTKTTVCMHVSTVLQNSDM